MTLSGCDCGCKRARIAGQDFLSRVDQADNVYCSLRIYSRRDSGVIAWTL